MEAWRNQFTISVDKLMSVIDLCLAECRRRTTSLVDLVEGESVEQQIVQKLKPSNGQWMLLLPATSETTIANIESRYR